MTDEIRPLLAALCEAAATLVRRGLVLGRGGNVSARAGEWVYISPRGASLEHLQPDRLVPLDLTTGRVQGTGRPSSEWPMHVAAYRARPEARVVVHCHPPHVIAVASLGQRLPALTPDFLVYMEATSLPTVPYHTPGTSALAQAVEAALAEAPVVLLANHGLLAVGESVEQALTRVFLAEETARIYLLARQVGQPRTLGEAEWAALREAGYNTRGATSKGASS